MATYIGELVCRWNNETGTNEMGPVAAGYLGAFTDVTGQPDANIIPEPNALVIAFEVDIATAKALSADERFVVLWLEAVKGEAVITPIDDDVRRTSEASASRAPTLPTATDVTETPKDVIPPANERASLTTKLVQMGLRGTDLAAIITAQNARGEAAARLKELCKTFPKAKP